MWTIKILGNKTRTDLEMSKTIFLNETQTKVLTKSMVLAFFNDYNLYKLNDFVYDDNDKLIGSITKVFGKEEIYDTQLEKKLLSDFKIMNLKKLEKLMIERTLQYTEGNFRRAAKILGCRVEKIRYHSLGKYASFHSDLDNI